MKTISTSERRRRLAARHALIEPANGLLEATRSVLALHSSDPSTVYLSAWARSPGITQDAIAGSLYDVRDVVRIYGMRRTLWVVDRETHPFVEHSSTKKVAAASRRNFAKTIQNKEVAEDGDAWLSDVLERTADLVARQGPVLARDLSKQLPELSTKLDFFNRAGELIGSVGLSTRVLVQLALESRIVRANPVGSWISSQYRWAGMEAWLGDRIPDIDPAEAKARVLEKWLSRFGPATETDLKWWTGWTVTDVRRALAAIGAAEIALETGDGWILPDDLGETAESGPWVALLPSLDPTTMAWKERDWYLGDYGDRLFDRNGNAGPTVWADGRIVGGWAQRSTGEVVHELFEDVGAEAADAIAVRAGELEAWIGDARVTPRFRSPHDKQLSA